jgi:SAM-dependent methyltransferase
MSYSRYVLSRLLKKIKLRSPGAKTSTDYWTNHMVANDDWRNARDSLDHFHWRNQQYPGYVELMPVDNANDLVVLDYGCGPGNDLVGFCEFSSPKELIGADVSPTALKAAERRLALHGRTARLLKIDEQNNKLDLPDEYVDLVHSSGVLHHIENLGLALNEIYRVLKPRGRFQVMVYNYDSLWLHLYTAYMHKVEMGRYDNMELLEAFKRTTDGPNCPISCCYRPTEFVEIVKRHGFFGDFKGSSISLHELSLLPKRFDAIGNRKLNAEHRNFLSSISFDERGYPRVNGCVAGINACFEFKKL